MYAATCTDSVIYKYSISTHIKFILNILCKKEKPRYLMFEIKINKNYTGTRCITKN